MLSNLVWAYIKGEVIAQNLIAIISTYNIFKEFIGVYQTFICQAPGVCIVWWDMHWCCMALAKCDGLLYNVLISVMLCIPSLTCNCTCIRFSVYWLWGMVSLSKDTPCIHHRPVFVFWLQHTCPLYYSLHEQWCMHINANNYHNTE